MVQKDSSSSGDENSPKKEVVPEVVVNTAKGVPVGKYHLVGWAADVTGGRLIDEICQLATFTPKTQFSQYIMPHTDFSVSHSYRHRIQIVNTVKYRRLRNVQTREFVKTKSEISALLDFIQWLEEVKGDSEGIILAYHERFKCSPGKLLEAVSRYNLNDRFNNCVKGFANVFNIAQIKCANITKSLSLHILSKVLLNSEYTNFSSAVDRAKAAFEIAVHFAQGEREDLDGQAGEDCSGIEPHVIEFICSYTNPLEVEEQDFATWRDLISRQHTFLPIFKAFLGASPNERLRAKYLQRLLAENNLTFEKLREVYTEKSKDGLESVITEEIPNAKDNDLPELLNLLDSFFDPEKIALQPTQPLVIKHPHHNKRVARKSYKGKNSGFESKHATNKSNNNDPVIESVSNPESPECVYENKEAEVCA